MALTKISTDGFKDDAVTTDKLANAINTERTANTAKVSLDADSVTGAKISDDAVGAEHIEVLDSHLQLTDNSNIKLGTGDDLLIYHNGSDSYVKNSTGDLYIRDTNGNVYIQPKTDENGIKCIADGAVELYNNNSKKLETTSAGVTVSHSNDSGATTLKLENNSTANSTDPKVQIAVDLASGKDGGSIEFIRESNYQSSAAADSAIVISPTKNDTNQEAVRVTQDWFRLHSNCSGIQFNSDTAAANALNDYEEGTWTPADGSGQSLSFTVHHANYLKIGKLVFISFYITFPSTSTTQEARINNLPFTSANAYAHINGKGYGQTYFIGQIEQSHTTMYFMDGTTFLSNANLSGDYALLSGCYIAA